MGNVQDNAVQSHGIHSYTYFGITFLNDGVSFWGIFNKRDHYSRRGLLGEIFDKLRIQVRMQIFKKC